MRDICSDLISALARQEISLEVVLDGLEEEISSGRLAAADVLALLETNAAADALAPDTQLAIKQRIQRVAGLDHDFHGEDPLTDISDLANRNWNGAPVPDDNDQTRIVLPEEKDRGNHTVLKERFELLELLGEGGMGQVYKALDYRRRDMGDRSPYVALKLLSGAFRRLEISNIALHREADKALKLAHPNIVRVYDFDKDDDDLYFMTMEFLAGRTLKDVIQAPGFTGLPLDQAVQMIRPAAAALAYAHDNNIVHADFKPSNIFQTNDGQIKVIDFGIARAIKRKDVAESDRTLFDPSMYNMHSPPYAPPEHFEGGEIDARYDVYALACVTYELLTGDHPFDRLSGAEAKRRRSSPKQPRGLTNRQWQGLLRALAFEPDQRTPTVSAFMAEMTAERPSRGYLRAIAGAAAAVAAISVLLWVFWPWLAPEPQEPILKRDAEIARVGPVPEEKPEEPETPAEPIIPPPATVEPEVRTEPEQVDMLPAPEPEPIQPPLPSQVEVEGLLAQISCAVLEGTVVGRDVSLAGQARSAEQLAMLEGRVASLGGVAAVRSDAVGFFQAFHCPPIDAVRPYLRLSQEGASGAAITPARDVFYGGENLMVDLASPAQPSFAYVDLFDRDGNVLHLMPTALDQNNVMAPKSRTRLGTGGEWEIWPPFGSDLLVAVWVPEALGLGVRQDVERTADYLPLLRAALDGVIARHGAGHVIADYAFLNTQPAP